MGLGAVWGPWGAVWPCAWPYVSDYQGLQPLPIVYKGAAPIEVSAVREDYLVHVQILLYIKRALCPLLKAIVNIILVVKSITRFGNTLLSFPSSVKS